MAVDFKNVPFKLSKEDMGVPDYLGSLNKGLNLFQNTQKSGYLPQRLQDEQTRRQYLNQINQPYAENANRVFEADVGTKEDNRSLLPWRQKLLEAKFNHEQQIANDPFGGKMPSGDVGQVVWLKKLEDTLPGGKENPYYQQAKKALELNQKQAEGLNNYRKWLLETGDKRASTPLGKLENEMKEVESGYMPSSHGTIKLEPEEQELLLGQYQLAQQKLTSDVDTRKKLLFATNLDKTLDAINVNDLVQYGGLSGGLEKRIQEGKALTENEADSFQRYHKALTAAKLLAKQVRQFYGDSITPGVQEQLGQLTNPASWTINPKLAKAKFEQFKSILKSETQTYRDATQNTNVYHRDPENNLRTNMEKASTNEQRFENELTYNPATGRLE